MQKRKETVGSCEHAGVPRAPEYEKHIVILGPIVELGVRPKHRHLFEEHRRPKISVRGVKQAQKHGRQGMCWRQTTCARKHVGNASQHSSRQIEELTRDTSYSRAYLQRQAKRPNSPFPRWMDKQGARMQTVIDTGNRTAIAKTNSHAPSPYFAYVCMYVCVHFCVLLCMHDFQGSGE